MLGKIILNSILILCLVAVQLGFLSGLPGWLSYTNLALVILVFLLGLYNLNMALAWAAAAGLLIDFFGFDLFGAHTVAFITAAIITDLLLVNFFTNRSLYSFLALATLAFLCYEIILLLFINGNSLITGGTIALIPQTSFFMVKAGSLIMNLAAVSIIFFMLAFASKKFKPGFLSQLKT